MNRRCQLQEGPEQIERVIGIVRGNIRLDHAQKTVEVFDQCLLLAPVHEGRRAPQRGEALTNIRGNIVWALCGADL